MKCPRCKRAIPDGASLCRACGHVLDAALDDEHGAGSGFTAPGVSIHAIRPVASTGSSRGFSDVPNTQETGKPSSLPPEFVDDEVETGASATIIDSARHITPSQLDNLRRPEPTAAPAEADATMLSSVPDAVLRHLRSEISTSESAEEEGDGMVFQPTDRWERPEFPSAVDPEDATVVRPSPYSNVNSDVRTPSKEG